MNILKKMEREIERAYDALATLDPNSEAYSALDRDINDMVARYTELKKAYDEEQSKAKELELADQDRKSEKRHRWIGYAITLVGIGAPLLVKVTAYKWAFIFEENATIASGPGRASFNDIIKK